MNSQGRVRIWGKWPSATSTVAWQAANELDVINIQILESDPSNMSPRSEEVGGRSIPWTPSRPSEMNELEITSSQPHLVPLNYTRKGGSKRSAALHKIGGRTSCTPLNDPIIGILDHPMGHIQGPLAAKWLLAASPLCRVCMTDVGFKFRCGGNFKQNHVTPSFASGTCAKPCQKNTLYFASKTWIQANKRKLWVETLKQRSTLAMGALGH